MIGFAPGEVSAMSVWQFNAAVAGYVRAHAPEGGAGLSESEEDRLWARIKDMG